VTESHGSASEDAVTPEESAEAGSFGAVADEGLDGVDTDVEAPVGAAGSADSVDDRITELTGDLQRLQAEYVNYKKRVDRDRELVAQNATYKVLAPIVEVLDTIDRAREHGELAEDSGFKAVAEQLSSIVTGLGLTKFGEPGDAFDPTLHEALSHLGAEEGIETTTVKVLAKAGYRIGDRVVRAAQVLVVDPA
jgi:molecular chaperone GrpE